MVSCIQSPNPSRVRTSISDFVWSLMMSFQLSALLLGGGGVSLFHIYQVLSSFLHSSPLIWLLAQD